MIRLTVLEYSGTRDNTNYIHVSCILQNHLVKDHSLFGGTNSFLEVLVPGPGCNFSEDRTLMYIQPDGNYHTLSSCTYSQMVITILYQHVHTARW